jgi:hypothetical protein
MKGNKAMKKTVIRIGCMLGAVMLGLAGASAADAKKPLKVFILAG